VDVHLTSAITVVVMDRGARLIDGQLLEVGIAMAVDLGIEIGEDASLEKRIIAEVDTANDMARLELIFH
jgi:hypothetical protein